MTYQFKDEREFAFSWRNNGLLPAGDPKSPMSVKDAIATPNASMWLPKIISNIVREAAEPMLIGASLLTRIEHHHPTITFGAVGALEAADIAEGQAYPEKQLSAGGATVVANIGKSGIAVKITDEMVRYSQFDVINMHLRAAGRALARHKEKKIFNFINSMGAVCFDNLNPTSSAFGVTHGRDITGAANGSVVVDDLFDMYSQILLQGFTPNTLLMHPLCWAMFSKDPVLRAMALNNGGGVFFATHSGNPADRQNFGNDPMARLSLGAGQEIVQGGNAGSQTATALEGYSQNMTGAPNLPSYFPYAFRVIVSPFVQFDPRTKLSNIMMFDSNELGALIVDEEVTMDEWRDQSVDMTKIKLRERYGIGIFNEGQAVGIMRNVKITANEIVLPAQASVDVSGSVLGAISATTPLSL